MSALECSGLCDELLVEDILDAALFMGQSELNNVWRKLGSELELRGYNTAGIDMPSIDVLLLSLDGFVVIDKWLKRENPRWQEYSLREHGRAVATEEAAAFLAHTRAGYAICISMMGLVCNSRDPLGHELLHVWEDELHLAVGTLTKECDDFLQELRTQYRWFKNNRSEQNKEREMRQ